MNCRAPFWALVVLALASGCASARMPEADRVRADSYEQRAEAARRQGDLERALMLAARALVVRIAACGTECPEVGYSFVQLGDLRWENRQYAWAAQNYRRAVEVFQADAHGAPWAETARARLALAERAAQR